MYKNHIRLQKKSQSVINKGSDSVKQKYINFNVSDIELKFNSTLNGQNMNELTKDKKLNEFKTNKASTCDQELGSNEEEMIKWNSRSYWDEDEPIKENVSQNVIELSSEKEQNVEMEEEEGNM